MCDCFVCERIEQTRRGENPYLVRELETGYVVMGDIQRLPGYALFLCKRHACELHELEPEYRRQFLWEMSLAAEAVDRAFQPDKLNYELLGTGKGVHMHWHIFPRRAGDTPKPGPVWQLGAELKDERYRPDDAVLRELKRRLNAALDEVLAADGQTAVPARRD